LEPSILKKIANYCVYQERCHKEVLQKLRELKIVGDEAEEALAWLITENYVNEERFARHFASSKCRLKKWGKRRILLELKARGLSPYCVKAGLAEIDEETYLQNIQELVQKKKNENVNISNPLQLRQKIIGYLFQKGYESHEIMDLL
jgi:regulatory protein